MSVSNTPAPQPEPVRGCIHKPREVGFPLEALLLFGAALFVAGFASALVARRTTMIEVHGNTVITIGAPTVER